MTVNKMVKIDYHTLKISLFSFDEKRKLLKVYNKIKIEDTSICRHLLVTFVYLFFMMNFSNGQSVKIGIEFLPGLKISQLSSNDQINSVLTASDSINDVMTWIEVSTEENQQIIVSFIKSQRGNNPRFVNRGSFYPDLAVEVSENNFPLYINADDNCKSEAVGYTAWIGYNINDVVEMNLIFQ